MILAPSAMTGEREERGARTVRNSGTLKYEKGRGRESSATRKRSSERGEKLVLTGRRSQTIGYKLAVLLEEEELDGDWID